MRPHLVIQSDVMDEDGNLRAADIGITWAGNETFLHGVRWLDRAQHDQQEWDRWCQHHINRHENTAGSIRPQRHNHWHRCHQQQFRTWRSSNAIPHTRYTSGVSTGCPHSMLQQQVPELAGVVQAFPGGCWRPWLEQRPESITTGVLPRRNRHERGSGTGR